MTEMLSNAHFQDEQEIFEERTPGAALASSNAMKFFEEYAAKFPLKRFTKEREAKDERTAKAARGNGSKCSSISSTHTSSEDSLLVSPVGQMSALKKRAGV